MRALCYDVKYDNVAAAAEGSSKLQMNVSFTVAEVVLKRKFENVEWIPLSYRVFQGSI